jgi:heptosyltransferase-3
MNNIMHNKIRNILVIKLRYLGDVVLTSQVFESLRYYYPQASITALVNKGTESMLTENPSLDNILVLERFRNLAFDMLKQVQLILKLRRFHFDLALELTSNDRGAFMSFLSGARKRLGYLPKEIKRFDRRLLFTDFVLPRAGEHIVDRHLKMIEYLGHKPLNRESSLHWSKTDEALCRQIVSEKGHSLDDSYVVLHPILRAKFRAWSIEGYAAMCDYIYKKWNIKTLIICGKDKDEVEFVDKILELTEESCIHLGGRLSLKQTIVLIANATLFIGVDSGPMHMAAAVRTPIIAIFGPQNYIQWGPYGEGHTVIQKTWDCVPCVRNGCNDNGAISRCLEELSIKEVIEVIDYKMNQLMSNKSARSRSKHKVD